MAEILAVLLFSVFLFLSIIHFYWAFGGKWGTEGVYPTPDVQTPPRNPGVIATLVVAIVLFVFGAFYLSKVNIISVKLPFSLEEYGLWILTTLFAVRAIGDFKFLGFFKKIKDTKFGQNDTKYFVPLCLVISILTIILELYC